MTKDERQGLPSQPSQSEGWQLWRFNPRFYRARKGPRTYQEIYWVFGFEFLAMLALGAAVYFGSIKPNIEQHRKEMEIHRRLKEIRANPAGNTPAELVGVEQGPSSK